MQAEILLTLKLRQHLFADPSRIELLKQIRANGGKGGGTTILTRYAERLLQLYDLLGQIQQKAFDVLEDDTLPLDSLLAAISRFSLQTSACNQFFGTIVSRSRQAVQQQVTVAQADGHIPDCMSH